MVTSSLVGVHCAVTGRRVVARHSAPVRQSGTGRHRGRVYAVFRGGRGLGDEHRVDRLSTASLTMTIRGGRRTLLAAAGRLILRGR